MFSTNINLESLCGFIVVKGYSRKINKNKMYSYFVSNILCQAEKNWTCVCQCLFKI